MQHFIPCTLRKVHFLTLFLAPFLLLSSLETSGHTVVLSLCKLKYEQDGWRLYFQQKTRPLRDAIYAGRLDLKGMNLNSELFLRETHKYITNNFTLKNEGKPLTISPKYLKYDGRNFEGQFFVKGLPKNPDDLTIETSGFDVHEHSMKVLSIIVGDQAYLYNFNKEQNQAIFSFNSKQYLSSKEKTYWEYKPLIFYITGLLIVCLMMIRRRLIFWVY